MAVRNPRDRILIFRLTKDEYETIQTASSGARSLSEFARTRLMGALETSPIDMKLTELKITVTRLAQLLEKE
jgi:hypothetical protein